MKNLFLLLIFLLTSSTVVLTAQVQPMGIAEGSFKIDSNGSIYVPSYCMDYTLSIPQLTTKFINVLSEFDKAILIYDNEQMQLQQAIDKGNITISGGTRDFHRLYSLYNTGQLEWLRQDEIHFFENTWPKLSALDKEEAKKILNDRADYRTLRFINNTDKELEICFLENTVLADREKDIDYFNADDILSASNYEEQSLNQNMIWEKSEALKVERTIRQYNNIENEDNYKNLTDRFNLLNRIIVSYSVMKEIDRSINYLEDMRQRIGSLYNKDYKGPDIRDICHTFYLLSYHKFDPEIILLDNNWPYIIVKKDKLKYSHSSFYLKVNEYLPTELNDWYLEEGYSKNDNYRSAGGVEPPTLPVPVFVKLPSDILNKLGLSKLFSSIEETRGKLDDIGIVLVNEEDRRYFIYYKDELYKLFEIDHHGEVIALYDIYGPEEEHIVPMVYNNRWIQYDWDAATGEYLDTGALFMPYLFE